MVHKIVTLLNRMSEGQLKRVYRFAKYVYIHK
nr:MAG TPA: hypothetical protein [Bacteriophage sp.]